MKRRALTDLSTSATQSGVGRKKQIETRVLATLHEGVLERIAAVLRDGENRTEFFREAIESELRRRERAKRREGSQS